MISYKTAERVINPVRSIGDFTVTPEVAEYWLEQYNVHNRSLKWDHIAAMAGAIQRGEWVYNATPISFGVLDDGQVFQVDGQHRCYAIVKAGLPVPSAVATGLEAKAQDYIDIGRHRHYADQLQLAGIPNTKATAAVVRAIWIYRAYEQVGNKFKITPTHAQLEHLRLELMPALLVDIDRALRVSRAIKGPMGVYGLASHLFTVKDPAMAAEFFEGLEKGADLRARHPILILRDRLRDNASAKAKLNEEEIAAHAVTQENYVQAGVYLATVESRLWDFDSHYLRECAVPRIHKAVAMLKGIYQKSDGAWVNGMDLVAATDVLGEAQEYVLRGVTLVVAEVGRQQNLARKAP